jgi:hypothetical protein
MARLVLFPEPMRGLDKAVPFDRAHAERSMCTVAAGGPLGRSPTMPLGESPPPTFPAALAHGDPLDVD